ncbi:MAG: hypothetical protein CMO43_13065 [Verrucomicrobiales bacterium]|jgi:hypothetical protein|nr:hypothetical protein [Verrucomicrobiales bacterium]
MSTQDQPSLWKWYVLKAVIAALILYAGYNVFIDKPSPEVPAPTQDELDALSGNIELIEEEPEPELVPGPPAEQDPTAAVEQPVTNFVELVQPMDEMPEAIDGYEGVTFDKLASFAYEVPLDPVTNKVELAKLNAQIPESIKSLDRKPVAIRGFMLPLKVENGLVTELLIMRDQSMCCFGTVPKINEWINIRMAGDGVQPIMDQAITLMGQLKVGEVLENDYLVGIYEMEGDRMIGPLDL